ncbi:MAG TPA: hypothetical protein VK528_10190, partial [Flavobacterium sp.]|nr:hypothetical protein [Flavobacterium sp.]
MKHCKLLLVAIALLCAVWGNAQNDCADAIVVCGNTGFQGLTATGSGISELNSNNSCSGVETNTIWLKLPIKTGGTLGFTLVPESTDIFEDFDFYIFGPNVTCGVLGNAIRCSTTNPDNAGLADNLTGMNNIETDVSEGPGFDGNSFVNWLTVNSGDTYYIVIDRPFGQSNFSLQWTGTAVFEGLPDLPTAGINLDLQECDHDSVDDASTTFNLTQNNAAILGVQTGVTLSYHTNSNDVLTGDNPIPDPTNFTNTINPQPIFVRIVNTITGCFEQVAFSVQVNNSIHIPNDTFTLCDDGADGDGTNGQTNFNLNDVTEAIFGGMQNAAGLTIKYYSSQFNALNDIGAFLNTSFHNTVANQQVIYVWATDPVVGCL